jgi:hypothetical protein
VTEQQKSMIGGLTADKIIVTGGMKSGSRCILINVPSEEVKNWIWHFRSEGLDDKMSIRGGKG